MRRRFLPPLTYLPHRRTHAAPAGAPTAAALSQAAMQQLLASFGNPDAFTAPPGFETAWLAPALCEDAPRRFVGFAGEAAAPAASYTSYDDAALFDDASAGRCPAAEPRMGATVLARPRETKAIAVPLRVRVVDGRHA